MRHDHTQRRKLTCRGFSLVELMVVLTIAVILMALAAPSFQSLLDRQRLVTAASDLLASVTFTRAEAIRRGSRVDLLPEDPANWAMGWKITVPGVPAETIYSHPPAPNSITITQNFSPFPADQSLSYDGTGRTRLKTDSTVERFGSWTLSVNNSQGTSTQTRNLNVNQLGRPFLCDPARPPC